MAGAMAASLMAGCGVSTDTGAGSGSDSTGGDTASTATSDTSEATGDEEEITWAFWDDLNASQSAEQVCLDRQWLLKSGQQEKRIAKLILRQLTP